MIGRGVKIHRLALHPTLPWVACVSKRGYSVIVYDVKHEKELYFANLHSSLQATQQAPTEQLEGVEGGQGSIAYDNPWGEVHSLHFYDAHQLAYRSSGLLLSTTLVTLFMEIGKWSGTSPVVKHLPSSALLNRRMTCCSPMQAYPLVVIGLEHDSTLHFWSLEEEMLDSTSPLRSPRSDGGGEGPLAGPTQNSSFDVPSPMTRTTMCLAVQDNEVLAGNRDGGLAKLSVHRRDDVHHSTLTSSRHYDVHIEWHVKTSHDTQPLQTCFYRGGDCVLLMSKGGITVHQTANGAELYHVPLSKKLRFERFCVHENHLLLLISQVERTKVFRADFAGILSDIVDLPPGQRYVNANVDVVLDLTDELGKDKKRLYDAYYHLKKTFLATGDGIYAYDNPKPAFVRYPVVVTSIADGLKTGELTAHGTSKTASGSATKRHPGRSSVYGSKNLFMWFRSKTYSSCGRFYAKVIIDRVAGSSAEEEVGVGIYAVSYRKLVPDEAETATDVTTVSAAGSTLRAGASSLAGATAPGSLSTGTSLPGTLKGVTGKDEAQKEKAEKPVKLDDVLMKSFSGSGVQVAWHSRRPVFAVFIPHSGRVMINTVVETTPRQEPNQSQGEKKTPPRPQYSVRTTVADLTLPNTPTQIYGGRWLCVAYGKGFSGEMMQFFKWDGLGSLGGFLPKCEQLLWDDEEPQSTCTVCALVYKNFIAFMSVNLSRRVFHHARSVHHISAVSATFHSGCLFATTQEDDVVVIRDVLGTCSKATIPIGHGVVDRNHALAVAFPSHGTQHLHFMLADSENIVLDPKLNELEEAVNGVEQAMPSNVSISDSAINSAGDFADRLGVTRRSVRCFGPDGSLRHTMFVVDVDHVNRVVAAINVERYLMVLDDGYGHGHELAPPVEEASPTDGLQRRSSSFLVGDGSQFSAGNTDDPAESQRTAKQNLLEKVSTGDFLNIAQCFEEAYFPVAPTAGSEGLQEGSGGERGRDIEAAYVAAELATKVGDEAERQRLFEAAAQALF